MDRRSFEEFSLTLQELIRQAANHSRLLQSTKADAGTMEGHLRDTTKELQSRLERAAKLLPALEQRVARAEKLLELAVDPAKHAETVEKLIAERMAARASEFEQRLARAVEQLTGRFRAEQDAVESRAREVEARAQEFALSTARAVEDLAAQSERQAANLEARTQELRAVLQGELSAVTSRIGEVETQITQTAGHAQETRSILDHHAMGILDSLREQAKQVEADAGKARADLEHRTAALLASLGTAGETIGARHRDLDAAAARKAEELEAHGATIRESLDALGERAADGLARQLEAQRTTMADLEREIEQRVARGQTLLDDGLNRLGGEIDRGRAAIDRHTRGVVESLEAQTAAVSDLAREVEERVRQIEAAAVQGVDRVEMSAARAGEELTARAGELLSGIRGETHTIAVQQVQITAAGKRTMEQIGAAAIEAAATVERQRGEATAALDGQRGYIVEQKVQIEEVLNQAERTLGPLIGRGQAVLNELDGRLQAIGAQVARLESGNFERMAALVARADEASRGADLAARQFEAMKTQAEQARAMLSDGIMAAAGWIDAMEERREAIVKESGGVTK
ncbi:MAG: hypothetical protein IT436_11735 [Phycisphaerales bacterium]|nr:hypothetical protein [Phycisphaerales bacterium]